MRILQIIDSLEIGGAEKMAINYANALYARYRVFGFGFYKSRRKFTKSVE